MVLDYGHVCELYSCREVSKEHCIAVWTRMQHILVLDAWKMISAEAIELWNKKTLICWTSKRRKGEGKGGKEKEKEERRRSGGTILVLDAW